MDENSSEAVGKGDLKLKGDEPTELEEDELELEDLELEEVDSTKTEKSNLAKSSDKKLSGAHNRRDQSKSKENNQYGTTESKEITGPYSGLKTQKDVLGTKQKPNVSFETKEELLKTGDAEFEDKIPNQSKNALDDKTKQLKRQTSVSSEQPEKEQIEDKDSKIEDPIAQRTLASKEQSKETSKNETKSLPPNSSVIMDEERIEIEELEEREVRGTLELEEQREGTIEDESKEESAVPLLVGESVSIHMQGASPTVHVNTAQRKGGGAKKKESLFTNPVTQLRNAWEKSTNVYDFLLKVVLLVFSTLGWILCSGGLPFVSIAMFIIGSVYIDACRAQPNIPVYLIVGGVLGTVQHFVAYWNKCLPESRQGRLSRYRVYYSALDGALTLFLLVWFIIGCAWVYGVKEVEFRDTFKDEYCHKTVYYFAFWLLNINFILIALVAVSCIGLLLFVLISPKEQVVV